MQIVTEIRINNVFVSFVHKRSTYNHMLLVI